MTLAPPPPHALPRPGAHLAPHRMCMCAPPFDSAESKLLVRRQQAAHALHPAKLRVKIGSSVARGSHRATIFDHHNIESVGRRLLYDCIRPVLAPVKVLGVCVSKKTARHTRSHDDALRLPPGPEREPCIVCHGSLSTPCRGRTFPPHTQSASPTSTAPHSSSLRRW